MQTFPIFATEEADAAVFATGEEMAVAGKGQTGYRSLMLIERSYVFSRPQVE